MVDTSRKTFKEIVVKTIKDRDEILGLNKKHIEDGLDHKNMPVSTKKYSSNYRKHRYELVDKPKNNPIKFA